MLLLMSMCYLSFLRGDIIIEQYEMMKWKYFNEVTIVNGKRSRAASNISEIEDTREKEEMTKKANEAVKNMIEHTSNIYLLKYIQHYWEDYESVKSNEEAGRSFMQLRERQLNQLDTQQLWTVSNKHALIWIAFSVQPPCRTCRKQPCPSDPSAHRGSIASPQHSNTHSPPAS